MCVSRRTLRLGVVCDLTGISLRRPEGRARGRLPAHQPVLRPLLLTLQVASLPLLRLLDSGSWCDGL
jgi:hypothetical protein